MSGFRDLTDHDLERAQKVLSAALVDAINRGAKEEQQKARVSLEEIDAIKQERRREELRTLREARVIEQELAGKQEEEP